MPRIFLYRFLPRFQAPEKVKQEEELRPNRNERRNGDKNMHRLKSAQERYRGSVEITPGLSRKSQKAHGHENCVDPHERKPQIYFPQPFDQAPAKHFAD